MHFEEMDLHVGQGFPTCSSLREGVPGGMRVTFIFSQKQVSHSQVSSLGFGPCFSNKL